MGQDRNKREVVDGEEARVLGEVALHGCYGSEGREGSGVEDEGVEAAEGLDRDVDGGLRRGSSF